MKNIKTLILIAMMCSFWGMPVNVSAAPPAKTWQNIFRATGGAVKYFFKVKKDCPRCEKGVVKFPCSDYCSNDCRRYHKLEICKSCEGKGYYWKFF